MVQTNLFNVSDECYDCGCDLKPACADREGNKMKVESPTTSRER